MDKEIAGKNTPKCSVCGESFSRTASAMALTRLGSIYLEDLPPVERGYVCGPCKTNMILVSAEFLRHQR